MSKRDERNADGDSGRLLSWSRIRVIVIGSAIALVLGLAIAFLYTSGRYGGSPLDSVFKTDKHGGPDAGKHAYDKSSNTFLGVIKSEGYSTRRGTEVYYIERAGGQLIEVPKRLVAARQSDRR